LQDAALGPVVVGLLHDDDVRVRDAAAGAIAQTAEHGAASDDEARRLARLLVLVMGTHEHLRCDEVFRVCFARIADVRMRSLIGESAGTTLGRADHAAANAGRSWVRRRGGELPISQAWALARFAGVDGAMMRRALGSPAEFAAVLSMSAHLVLNPQRCEALTRAIRSPSGRGRAGALLKAMVGVTGVPEERTAMAIALLHRCAEVLGADEARGPNATGRNMMSRLLALEPARRRPGLASAETARDLCFDASAAIARAAAIIVHTPPVRARLGPVVIEDLEELLMRSGHRSVRLIARMAARSGRAIAQDRLLRLDPTDARVRLSARRWQRRDRPGSLSSIKSRMEQQSDPEGSGRAIEFARRLGLAGECEDVLVGLIDRACTAGEACDRANRLGAAACSALGPRVGEPALAALVRACGAHDSRLRSNAIEALARCARSDPHADAMLRERLAVLFQDGHHRPRSTAAMLWIVRHGESSASQEGRPAIAVLSGMLSPSSQRQTRRAGLWATRCSIDSCAVDPMQLWAGLHVALGVLSGSHGHSESTEAAHASVALSDLRRALRAGWAMRTGAVAGLEVNASGARTLGELAGKRVTPMGLNAPVRLRASGCGACWE
jgi:hypothetical protein